MYDIDDILGTLGKWHWPVMILNAYMAVPHSWFVMAPSFMEPSKLKFWCSLPENVTLPDWKQQNEGVDLRCFTNYTGTLEKCTNWQFDTSEMYRPMQKDFETVCDNSMLTSVHQSLLMGGLMVGNFIFSHLSDWFGRKPLLGVCVLFQLLFNVLLLSAPNYGWVLAYTFAAACGYGGLQNIPFTLAMESVGPAQRAFVSVCEEAGWVLGLCIFPICTYLIRDWRYLQLALVPPLLITAVVWCFCDESPRWLIVNGKSKDARVLLTKIGEKNSIQDIELKVNEILTRDGQLSCAREILLGEALQGREKYWETQELLRKTVKSYKNNNWRLEPLELEEMREEDNVRGKGSVVDLFRNWESAKIAISFYIQFAVSILLYFSLIFFIIDVGENPHLNLFVSALLELPLLPIAYFPLKKLERRTLYRSSHLTIFISTIALAFLPKGSSLIIQVVLASVGKWASQILFSLLVVHVAECFPTEVRALAVGSSLTMSRIGAIVAPFMKELDTRWSGLICAGTVLIAYLWSIVLPETSKSSLPNTLSEARRKREEAKFRPASLPKNEGGNAS